MPSSRGWSLRSCNIFRLCIQRTESEMGQSLCRLNTTVRDYQLSCATRVTKLTFEYISGSVLGAMNGGSIALAFPA